MKLELNVALIIQFFSLFVKLKLQIKKIEQDMSRIFKIITISKIIASSPSRGGLSPAIARPAQKTHANQRRFLDRGMARDRPSPYGGRETAWHTVSRGPSPAIRAGERVSPAIVRSTRKPNADQRRFLDRGMARDRPSPYGMRHVFSPSRGGLSPAIARPARKTHADPGRFLDRGMARDRPSPYGKRHAFFNRSAGACPPRAFT